ncbi:MAG: epoxide hydrolase family protein [Rhodococcus sp. (in: high G+C Gram-positive bacteria)]|uniref:epoxide hydrolase family protein n=1 Tax=Rhodococcus sp. TaxID=1831 RepID=UPI003D9B255F
MTTSTTSVAPFRIDIPHSALDDLRSRLDRARLPTALPGDDWSTGVPVSYLAELVRYWRNEYDWRAAEAKINALPQFTTEIDGQRIWFLHFRSRHENATPLLLTHGWPGSVLEFVGLAPLLTDPADPEDAFHLVVPALPGFGFSGPTSEGGWTTDRIARTWVELMTRLGYERFGTHGGDLGADVSPEVGRVAPDRVIGVHTNGGPGPYPVVQDDNDLAGLTELELRRVAAVQEFMTEQSGYYTIQATRPQTLAYGLVDSPVGQLAWIIEKFREWTWPREALPEEVVSKEWLITNVMLYWLTGTAGSAAYVGYAQGGDGGWGEAKPNSGVPTAAIVFAGDVGVRRFSETENTIVRWVDVDDGGHFAALEQPDRLAADMREFFRSLTSTRVRPAKTAGRR